MQESVFTKIIKGEIPCHKVYEDDKTLAFLTIGPMYDGHTLVVPKVQVDQYIDLPDEDYDALWKTVKKVSKRIRDVVGKERVGLIIEGVDIPHVHIHLIPFDKNESLKVEPASPDSADHKKLAQIAEKLAF